MSGEYRDDLSAAHSRIAELEEKVRVLEEAASDPPIASDGRFPELERRVALFRERADEGKHARRRTTLSIVGAAFPLAGGVFSYLHQPVLATVCSLIFIALIVYGQVVAYGLRAAKRNLAEAEGKLRDARRIAELEAQVAVTGVRIAQPEDISVMTSVDEEIEPRRAAR